MINTLFLPELREMLEFQQAGELKEFCEALNPGRTAEYMAGLTPAEAWQVLQHTTPVLRAEIFEFFDLDHKLAILNDQDPQEVAELLGGLPADDRVDLVQELSEQRVARLLALLPAEDRRDIRRLQSFAEGTAGALMTTEVAKLDERLTVREAFDELSRQAEQLETIYYLYVVDESERLRGVVSGRQLVSSLARPNTRLQDLMETDVIVVETSDDQEKVAELVERYNMLAIPVVDKGRRLVGIITHDDVIDVVREELTEDAHRIAAVAPLEDGYLRINLLQLGWKRGIWLTILFFAALLTAIALRQFDEELEKYTWLVLFIPLIISSGGNSGTQSATLVITAMTSGEVRIRDWRTILLREIVVGLMLGGFLGLLGWLVSLAVAPDSTSALVIPITVLAVVMSGCLCGATLPLIFKRLGLDPALMSNPFVAGIVDILGIVIYFNVARGVMG
ncbi:magnesium transporter [Roseimaritima ulvae]|uniref:Magnesium transporter MgtE n=1 Tax=Roseimaritima ulvae TaxID=980254 RepID=A0A5B9QP66_9BACT|nr:magnesium transporter [Roseimaritima ulvae]QEG39450.1 Magnesium transporter MgtE [Roseimaritima ulvae]